MTLEKRDLLSESSADIFANYPGVSMNDTITAVFGSSAGAENLERCNPVGYNDVTGYYGAWMAPDASVLEVDTDGATGGTWGLTVDGIVIANTVLAYNASADLVASTILASTGVVASVSLASGVYSIVFDADVQLASLPSISGDVSALTGAGGSEAAVATAGTASNGLHVIRGFVWPDEVQLSASLEVHGEIMVQGRIEYSYIAAVVDSGDLAALQAELKRTPLGRGIIVEGLSNIH